MKRMTGSLVLILILIMGISVVAWDALSNARASARLPSAVRAEVLSSFGGAGSPTIRASLKYGDTIYVGVESQTGLSSFSQMHVFVIRDQKIVYDVAMSVEREVFAASAGYTLQDDSYYVMGVAHDSRIAKVVGVSASGRKTEAVLFSGYWVMFPPMQSEEADKIIEVTAIDKNGNTIYRSEPMKGPQKHRR